MDELRALIREMLGCDWGSKITAAADLGLCEVRAVQRMAIHDPWTGKVVVLKFCTPHVKLMREETDSHVKGEPDGSPGAA